MQKACQVCTKPSTQQCSGCNTVTYCSEEHQREDWKLHKIPCRLVSTCKPAKPTQTRDPFDYANVGNDGDDSGRIISNILMIEHIRNGGNGIVPTTVQAHPQYLDGCLSSFDRVKALLSTVRKQNNINEDVDVVQKELNDCMNHFKIRYLLDTTTLETFNRIREANTFSSTDRMEDVVPADFMHRLLIQVCKQEFGPKGNAPPPLSISTRKWTYPWPQEWDGDWSHALIAKYGQVTDLDRRLQANLLESAVFPRATRYKLTQDEYITAMRRRMDMA